MNRTILALALLAAACRPEREPRPPLRPSQPVAVSRVMHEHFTSVRGIYRALLVDDLATARARARRIAHMPATANASKEWDDAARFLRAQAARLAAAPDPNRARDLATGMATYCADCHMFQARPSDFRPAPVPTNDGSVRAAMKRHEWGAETMWLGVIAPSTDLWQDGMAELSVAPRVTVCGNRQHDVAMLNARLNALASSTRDLGGQGDRARRLAEVLDVCAACHALTRP